MKEEQKSLMIEKHFNLENHLKNEMQSEIIKYQRIIKQLQLEIEHKTENIQHSQKLIFEFQQKQIQMNSEIVLFSIFFSCKHLTKF